MPLSLRISAFARRRPVAAALLCLAALFLLSVARYVIWPPVWRLAYTNPETTAFIEYRREEWREKGRHKTVSRSWKKLDAISPNLRKAVVVAEDTFFWQHQGFDFGGIWDALERNLKRGKLAAGGSTITQQLAKNLYFSPERSILRKIKEAIVALRLEWHLPKERILELYLNSVEWGDGIFGAEAAARRYFGTSASRLTKEQAAALALMLPSPLARTPDSPYVRGEIGPLVARMRIE